MRSRGCSGYHERQSGAGSARHADLQANLHDIYSYEFYHNRAGVLLEPWTRERLSCVVCGDPDPDLEPGPGPGYPVTA